MPKVIVIAQVQDPVRFEEGFRTHGDLFRSETVYTPIDFSIIEGNEFGVCFEPDDLNAFLEGMDSPETAEAMAIDGVKRETVKIYALDKEFQV